MSNFDSQYYNLLREVWDDGEVVTHKRTQQVVRKVHGRLIQFRNGFGSLPVTLLRKVSPKPAIAEQLFFLTGWRDPNMFLDEATSIWRDFYEEDGMLDHGYGPRMRVHNDDQIRIVLSKLKADPTTRHGVITIWQPGDLTIKGVKNVPCPVMIMLSCNKYGLGMSVVMRSNDLIVGMPFDVMGFAFLHQVFAQFLKVEPSTFSYFIHDAHVYTSHRKLFTEMQKATKRPLPPKFILPDNVFARIEEARLTRNAALVHELYRDCVKGLKMGRDDRKFTRPEVHQ